MQAVEKDPAELQAHIAGTYLSLRLGIGVIGVMLPWLLWIGDLLLRHEPLRASMSAYYYSPAMRNVFVGALVAVGVSLYLYKGFSRKEDWALNFAGAFAILVALVPTAPADAVDRKLLSWHGGFAVSLFLAMAYVAVFRAADTLRLIRNTRKAKRLRALYRTLGVGMVVSPLAAVGLTYAVRPESLVFFLEALGVLMFAAYWLAKTGEVRATDADRLALAGKLKAAEPVEKGIGVEVPGRLVQVEE